MNNNNSFFETRANSLFFMRRLYGMSLGFSVWKTESTPPYTFGFECTTKYYITMLATQISYVTTPEEEVTISACPAV
jgi:hypothetical protein